MSPWGRDDLMAMAAVRYCLGRMTYIVSDCVDWLHQVWGELAPNCREVIRRDIEEAFARDDAARAELDQAAPAAYRVLGMDMDRAQWERARKLWRT